MDGDVLNFVPKQSSGLDATSFPRHVLPTLAPSGFGDDAILAHLMPDLQACLWSADTYNVKGNRKQQYVTVSDAE